MSKKFTCLKYLLLCITVECSIDALSQAPGDFQTKNVIGNWSDFNSWNIYDGTTWVPAASGQLPGTTTNVFVQADQTISIDNSSAVCNDLNVSGNMNSKIAFSLPTCILSVRGNMNLFSSNHNCFGTWPPGAKIVFSGMGAQGFNNLSLNSTFVNIEVNKPGGTLTISSNFKFGSFILTAGNFVVGPGYDIQGSSASSSININGGTWTQNQSTTRLFSVGYLSIGPLNINNGSMILATSTGSTGLQFSTINITNGGTLTFNKSSGLIGISTSINVDATSTFNSALLTTPLPASVTFNGIVNYNQNGDQTIAPATYSYLKLNGTGNKTLGTGITTIPTNGTLEMSGGMSSPMLVPGGSLAVATAGTKLIYSSAASQNATATEWSANFQNVTINSLSVVNMPSLSRTIYGSLNLSNGTLNIGPSGSLTLDGATLTRTNGFLSGSSTGDFTVTGSIGGTVSLPLSGNISLRNITISGTRALTMDGVHNISLSGSFSIGSNAIYDNGGESQVIDGGGGLVIISGKFINRDKDNFTGTNGAIPGIVPALNTGSTIEYALTGNQIITPRNDYYNITVSGSGIKTPGSAFTPSGTLFITGSAVLNASGHNIGDGYTPTNFNMDGGRLVLGTTGTQPMMAGNYNLTAGIVQFNGSSLQTIRSKSYQNIEVTGAGVSNSDGNITLNAGGTFIVKNGGVFEINDNNIIGSGGTQTVTVETGGTFRCGNKKGFNGFAATLTDNSSIHINITNIQLQAGSTISYIRNGDQPITNANNLAYQNLSLSGGGIKTAPAGILYVKGNFTKSGSSVFAHNNGTVFLNGNGDQFFAGLTYNNLILSNATKTSSGTTTIIDSIKINAGTILSISNSDTVILHSDAGKTARVGQVGGAINYNTTGKFLAERYIPARKAWRFLSVSMNSDQTIKQAWQEGGTKSTDNSKPGYGTQITSNLSNWTPEGFDAYSVGGPSMKSYNPFGNNYIGIASTFNTFNNALGGYMIFIRGDRSATNITSPETPTTLRITGKLYTGSQPSFTLASGRILPVNNPYVSAIDLRSLSRSLNVFYYVFDPNRYGSYGFGAFQTLVWNGLDYDVIPGSGSYGAVNNLVENGQAFFASTLGSDTSIQITEGAKTFSSVSSRPFIPQGNASVSIRTNLYTMNVDGSSNLADGVLICFGNNYSNDIDGMDAKKLFNSGENLAIKTRNEMLVVERRNSPHPHDTVAFSLSGLTERKYLLKIIPASLEQSGISAFLEDTYLRVRYNVSLLDTTAVSFSVDSNPASASASRFHLIFTAGEGPLPVTFSSFKAYPKNENVAVEWNIENESGIKCYEVEWSGDGTIFTSLAITSANNGTPANKYIWIHKGPLDGYNYYRIKSLGYNGEICYTSIMRVYMKLRENQIKVFLDPLERGTVRLRFVGQLKGDYYVNVINASGAVIAKRSFKHVTGSEFITINSNFALASGVYIVMVRKPDGTIEKIPFVY